jgi:hypothetical protein
MTRAEVLSWDWHEQPDLIRLAAIIRYLSNDRVRLRQVKTGTDDYAIVLSDVRLTEAEAFEVYEKRWEDEK